jgi:hypothetical protein
MKSIYQLLGLASTQDVRDLQVSVASAHERIKTLEQSVTDAKFEFKNLRASVADAHGGTPSLRQRIAAVEVRSRCLDDIPAVHEALARTDETVESLQHKVDGLLDVNTTEEINSILSEMDVGELIDMDDLYSQVENNLDIEDAVNTVIEREAPDILGSYLKHIDWSEELHITAHSNR